MTMGSGSIAGVGICDILLYNQLVDTNLMALACTLVPADAGNGQIEYVLSALATAMVVGGVAFLDGLSRYPGQALSLLASVLDDRRYLDLDLIGERIHAHPNFRFIAASNVEDVQGLPEFLRSRLFPTLMLEQPAPEVISTIVQRQFPAQQQLIGELLTGFWRLWDRSTADPEPPSPRAVLQIFSLAWRIALGEAAAAAGGPCDRQRPCADPQLGLAAAESLRLEHVEQALQALREAGAW